MRGYLVKGMRGHLEKSAWVSHQSKKGKSSDILDSLTVHSFAGNSSQITD